ncbi:hypothetical protein FA95DRAFT_1489682 [Auriscalpium vulgare]|uniref:Uncharacterized protein n=1 Tax=Auriscalpium vulgare TaxID=40419 RepID=A0ACB8S099_9AGAM|nr:hypothetical protein FA95DRAFT_1489682 [Auriscalpium vulgare]
MADEYSPQHGAHEPEPHPYLHEPLLHISGIPAFVSDENLALAFGACAPFRPRIARDGSGGPVGGTIEFKYLEKAEKALATLQGRPIPGATPTALLVLSPYPPTTPPTPLPPPSASPRLVKHLPPGYTDNQLYDLFRSFGALASVRTQANFGKDTGVVEFWREEDARQAEEAMHCADVEGQNIAVQVYQPRRTSGQISEFSPSAPAFVPAAAGYPSPYPTQVIIQYSPPRASPFHVRSPGPFIHGPGQQVQLAPVHGPGSTSHSGLIDPCNLFCKNLDLSLDSNGLFSHFRQFGQIVSARVMRDERGNSRGFGFVSYQTPDAASAAMHAMNGAIFGNKQMVVRLHEPKQLRQEKLAARFSGHNGHPRSASGATSPTLSEGGESYAGWPSPSTRSVMLGSPVGHHDKLDRPRRGSGSYYNAALAGTLNLPMRYDDLSALSPVVRKEVLTGELSRRIKTANLVPPSEVDSVVESLVGLSLSEVLATIQDPEKLNNQVQRAQSSLSPGKIAPPVKSPSPALSHDSRLLDADALNATASAPEHPSTPVSIAASVSTPPRTSSPSGSVAPATASERERIFAAVSRLEPGQAEELTELLMSLPKRERAMCLFNVEVLRAKIADAKAVLDSDDAETPAPAKIPLHSVPEVPVTPQSKKTASTALEDTPRTPDLSSRGPSAAASPSPATPSAAHTIASLARLPAVEIIRLANSPSSTGLPLPKADVLVTKATDEFIDSLAHETTQIQKQKVGDKLFKIVKSFGLKSAPKLTIALLDQDDLRALAHLMNSYPSVLKEKAILVQQASSK